ncbi:MAG TPA: RES family NAD+ phosphorylase [Polyangiaceae bacterium]|nr:RES family NAD+ phosphorylase [Polyangiaceae bacterium]
MASACWKCFDDEYLRELIRREGEVDDCELCGSTARRALGIDRLRDLFTPVVGLYEDIVEFMPLEILKEGGHATLPEQFIDDWGIFDDEETATKFFDLCGSEDYDPDSDGFDPFATDRAVGIGELFFRGDYEESQRLLRAWKALKVEIATKNRFFAGTSAVNHLWEAIAFAETTIRRSTTLHRARACEQDRPLPKKAMGAPPIGSSTPGRANPRGIPYLYLASTAETAASELRPHVHDRLTLGSFRLARDLRVIDLRGGNVRIGSPFRWGDRLRAVVRVANFLGQLSRELSRPISRKDDLEYLPTQYLCELIKNRGFDGVVYESGVCAGYNLAVFEPSSARCVGTKLLRVSKIEIGLEPPSKDTQQNYGDVATDDDDDW